MEMQLQTQTSTPSNSSQTRRHCAGMALDSNGKFVQCPKTFTRIRSHQKFHSHECYEQTWHWKICGHVLGEVYVRGRHIKTHAPKACEGWTRRDGVITKCEVQFTPDSTRQKYHSNECLHTTRRLREQDLHVGQSQLRTCGYRNCKKGPGGTRGTFVRAYRRGSGFFCDGRCNAAERRCRKDDELAKLRALAQSQEAFPKREPSSVTRGRKKDPDTLAKIALAAKFTLSGKSQRAMSRDLYPERKYSPDAAYTNTRKLFSLFRSQIEAEADRLRG